MEENRKQELCSKIKNSEELKRYLGTPEIKMVWFRCDVRANICGKTEDLVWLTLSYTPTSRYNAVNCNNFDLFITLDGHFTMRSVYKEKSTYIKNTYWKFF